MKTTKVLLPIAERLDSGDLRMASRLFSLEGATVGIVNNSWRCMDIVTDEIRSQLTDVYGVQEVIETKISAAQTISHENAQTLADRAGAVIVGIGN